MGRPHGGNPVDGTPASGSAVKSAAIDYAMKALYLVLMLSMPPIIVASLADILSSLIRAITQLQGRTLTFSVRLLVVILTPLIMGGWFSGEILRYADNIFGRFHMIR